MIWRAFLFPRFHLISTPTPLEKAERLSKELGIELYIKRDDVMELAFGGNKARKLEFLLGDAISRGCDTLITVGAYHSNHVRLTIAAARKAGMDAYAVLTPPGEPEIQGNLFLDKLLGGHILYAGDRDEAERIMKELAEQLTSQGKKPYVIPGGGANAYGVLGYVTASLEIMQQLYSLGKKPDYIIHATGTGATQAGLVLGLKLLGVDEVEVIGVSVGRPKFESKERILKLINECARLMGVNVSVSEEDVKVVDNYTFGGYGVITREVFDTMKYMAEKEAIILDPVYTSKAMYGLIDMVRNGEIEKGSTVVFIHTGGTPIPFQKMSDLSKYLE
ncbi:MAG: hypothetical protein DRN30_01990 [Thermoplasmata archaeon]|nr:MAG: hypothetical protein DRN30_01990 [Thermoplasmata archaeon]